MTLTDIVQDYLLTNRVSSTKKEQKFYLSDMGKCMKIRWVKRHGVEQEFDPLVSWIFKIGDLYHDFVYKALEAKGILLESEDYVKTDHFIGRYDGIIKDDKEKAVMDIKSVGGWKFKKILDGNIDEEPIAQVLSYLMLLQDSGRKDLKKAMLFFMNKEPSAKIPHAFIEKSFHLTKWREEKLREEINILVKHWIENTVPKCTCPSWMKNYNSYLPFCQMPEPQVRKTLKYIEEGKRLITTKTALYLIDGEKRIVLVNIGK